MYRSRDEDEEDTGVYLRWPASLHEKVKEVARERGVSMNQLIVNILRESLFRVPVPLTVIERDGKLFYEISVPPDYFYEGEND